MMIDYFPNVEPTYGVSINDFMQIYKFTHIVTKVTNPLIPLCVTSFINVSLA